MYVKQSYTGKQVGRAYAYAFFRFYPALYLGACAVNGLPSEYIKGNKFPCDGNMCIFRTVHLGFINTENKGQIYLFQ